MKCDCCAACVVTGEVGGVAGRIRQKLPPLRGPASNKPEDQPKDDKGNYQSKEAANSKEAAPAEVANG